MIKDVGRHVLVLGIILSLNVIVQKKIKINKQSPKDISTRKKKNDKLKITPISIWNKITSSYIFASQQNNKKDMFKIMKQ